MLKDKEGKIFSLREKVHQAKKDGMTEFHNSNRFLVKLSSCYADGFNECLCQAKAHFPYLDIAQVSLDDVAQTPAKSVESDGTDELFEVDVTPDA